MSVMVNISDIRIMLRHYSPHSMISELLDSSLTV